MQHNGQMSSEGYVWSWRIDSIIPEEFAIMFILPKLINKFVKTQHTGLNIPSNLA